jgi:acyl-CoA reductase-like NAD-dependent aldehyde dehydrogenase
VIVLLPLASARPEAQEADAAVAAARRAFDDPDGWSQWEPSARAAAMERLAVELEARAAEMAQRVSAQNGMPISIATVLEGGFPVIVLRYLAGLLEGASFEEEQPIRGLSCARGSARITGATGSLVYGPGCPSRRYRAWVFLPRRRARG